MVAIKETSEQAAQNVASDAGQGADEAQELLDKARTILKKRLSFFVWQGFFEPLSALSFADGKLTLEAPTSFHRNWVIDHYMAELNASALEAAGHNIDVVITFDNDQQKKKTAAPKKVKEKLPIESPKNTVNTAVLPLVSPPAENSARVLPLVSNSNLNPTYNFDAYVQGPSNQMGYAAAMSVADQPGAQFSPLFLFGGVGLGKTHLLHAIGIRAKEANPTLKVVYLSAEQWVNSYIYSIRERRFDSFRDRFRKDCDILLIDDIQFFADKDASQDEFFHTFNTLHAAKKQIVVTSDKYPHEINGLEERLQTRLSWGLIADIRPPEIETRIAILHKKAEKLSVKLSDEVLNFLAASVTSSVRELEGALVRVAACSSLSKQEITLQQSREILSPVLKKKTLVVSPQKICEAVASYYDLRPSELDGKSRQRQVVFARQVAMSLCRTLLSMSLPEIGRAFGGRDHSTVLSSLRRVEEYKKGDVSLQAALNKLEEKITAMDKK